MNTTKGIPLPPHPLGDGRAERLKRWEMLALFGLTGPDDFMAELARRVLHAAEASDDEETARRALHALGIQGGKKTDNNRRALRGALQDLERVARAAFPLPDPETGEQAPEAAEGSEAFRQYRAVIGEGVPLWLFRRVQGHGIGDEPTHVQFLRRVAKSDPDLKPGLDRWLEIWRRERMPNLHSRGRVR